MPFNSNGVYILPATSASPAVGNTTITAAAQNTLMNDVRDALTSCIVKDGQTTITGNLPMAGFRHTGVNTANDLTDYSSADDIIDNTLLYAGASSVGTDAYAATLPISPGAYKVGQVYFFYTDVANTGACTIDFNSIGATSIKLANGNDPGSGDIQATAFVQVQYDGTNFELLNPATTNFLRNDIDDTTTGSLTFSSGTPKITFYESDVAATERRWRIYASTESLNFDISDDGETTGNSFISVDRAAQVIDKVTIKATDVKINGNLTADTTDADLPLVRNGTGDITVDSVPIYGLVILDSPQTLVNAVGNQAGWTTVDMSGAGGEAATAAAAGASKAILRYFLDGDRNPATSMTGSGYIRKTGSGLGLIPETKVTTLRVVDVTSQSLFAQSMSEATVNLDTNSDFDWHVSGTFDNLKTTIVLVGYYV